MKQLFFLFFFVIAVCAHAANPAFQDFNTNQFSTTGNKVTIKSGAALTNVLTPWVSDINAARFSLTNFNKLASSQTGSVAGFTIGDISDGPILKIDPLDVHTNAGSFYAFREAVANPNFGSGQSNQIFDLWSYNDAGTGRIKTNESAYRYTFETSWDVASDGVTRQQEKYDTYTSPAGQVFRLDQALHRWNVASGTNLLTQRDFGYHQFNFIGQSNNLAWTTFQYDGNNTDGGSMQIDGSIYTDTNSAGTGGLTIRKGGLLTIQNIGNNKTTYLYYPSTDTNRFYIADISGLRTNVFQDWGLVHIKTDHPNTKFAIKAGTAQTDNLAEFRNNSDVAQSLISSNGGFQTLGGVSIGTQFDPGKSNLVVQGITTNMQGLVLGPNGQILFKANGSEGFTVVNGAGNNVLAAYTTGTLVDEVLYLGSAQNIAFRKVSTSQVDLTAADSATDYNVTLKSGRLISTNIVTLPFTVSLTADDQSVSTTNLSYIRLSSDNGTAGNRTFVLSSGMVDGQQLDLEWTGTNAGEMADDASATGGGNIRLSATWTPTQYDVIGLRWNGTDWIERFRSTN